MKRHLTYLLVVITGLLCWLLTAQSSFAAGPTVKVTQVDPTEFPQITVYVTVTDEAGQLVGDLTEDDFQLIEDGQPVDIKDFAGLGEVRTVDIVFVFDTTGSMREEIEGVKNASIAFANRLRDKNRDFRLGLVAFGDEIREVRKTDGTLTANAEEFKRWIGRLDADGGGDDAEISLDGLERALRMKYRPNTQKVLILITDAPPHQRGDGTRFSHVVPDELVTQLRDQAFTIYAVTYDHPHFRRPVDETGGEFYDIDREADFTGIIDQIGGLIASQYRLTYTSARPSYDGTRRAVEVEVGGVKAESTYLEEHLINIRSNGVVALLFLVPLLLALIAPPAIDRIRSRQPKPAAQPPPQPQCPHCGQSLRSEAKFCSGCGQVVASQVIQPQVKFCTHCGQQLRPEANFCNSCGRRL